MSMLQLFKRREWMHGKINMFHRMMLCEQFSSPIEFLVYDCCFAFSQCAHRHDHDADNDSHSVAAGALLIETSGSIHGSTGIRLDGGIVAKPCVPDGNTLTLVYCSLRC
ncbi:Hypothetical protein, putative [Bodo saltans]|uniref:Uncharacterized protein n=1 Tax=Bodo saltans TaxID=75058 RepID=A0A0S4JU65_BODSA|nr:Hypothetical protein, putative [Bodo saltans]|eukprot:CUG94349.1 Hypothetical protein, putative [Bodo saltans]